jgi:hypothetical protein
MDNNILACDFGLREIERIIAFKCRVDFNQGLDARFVTPDVASMLAHVRWLRYIRFSMDAEGQIEPFIRAVDRLERNGIDRKKISVYIMLHGTLSDSYLRVSIARKMGCRTFAQPYYPVNASPDFEPPQWQKDLARYTNRAKLIKSIDFKDFRPRKGFVCSEYFTKIKAS